MFVLLDGSKHVSEALEAQTLIATPDTVTKKITGHTFGPIMMCTLLVPCEAQPDV
jgi:hypothetical protein